MCRLAIGEVKAFIRSHDDDAGGGGSSTPVISQE